MPVRLQRAGIGVGVRHRPAVTGEVGVLRPRQQPVERGHVVGHRPFRRGHHGGRPAHHMIAGEDEAAAGECEGDMVGRVAGNRDRLHPPAIAGDLRPVREPDVRHEIGVGAATSRQSLVRCRALTLARKARRAGRRGEPADAAAMVAMGVGDEDVGDGLVRRRRQQRPDMRLVVRSRIDDGDVAGADDVAVGAGEGEGAGISRRHPAHAGKYRLRPAIVRTKVAVEGETGHGDQARAARRQADGAGRGGNRSMTHLGWSACPTGRRVVGVAGFEPATPCSRSRCATRLRYTPVPGGADL